MRVTNLVFPQAFVIPMSAEMTISQWHVPIDDENCYWYAIFTSFTAPVDKQKMRDQRLRLYELPDYKSRKNKRNDYGFDPHEQVTETYTGMGMDINVHDQWAVESQGAIQDRTREHLGRPTRRSCTIAGCCAMQIEKRRPAKAARCARRGAGAAASSGPGTDRRHRPDRGWEMYWKEST